MCDERPVFREIYPAEPVFYVHCYDCSERFSNAELLANINGPSFVAFYCRTCAELAQDDWDEENGQFGVGA